MKKDNKDTIVNWRNVCEEKDVIEFEVDKMEFGGTSLSQVGDRVIHMKGGISGQKVRAGVKKLEVRKLKLR